VTDSRALAAAASGVDSPYAWARLAAAVGLGTVGGVGMWSMPVVLPAVQAEFAVARGDASLPFTLSMFGFALGGVVMGRLQDRFGILAVAALGIAALAGGYFCAALAPGLWSFALASALIGFGTSATFGPLMADVSFWFTTRRGIAVAIAAAGNYLAGTVWPPLIQHFAGRDGWRATYVGIGLVCLALMSALLPALRRPTPRQTGFSAGGPRNGRLDVPPAVLQVLLCIAGLACCVAMAMPQVHIVAYCGDLGYGVARGAEMLSLMLGFGIVSRIASGFVADRIGGLATLLIGSAAQGAALLLYLRFDGLVSLYVISALFGLFQGGIVPSYAFIIREYFPASEAGTRLGIVLMMTLLGMALGGWMSGAIFDLFGSYQAAFLNGLAWNLVNFTIAAWLLMRSRRRAALA
jgi:MFS family permease